MRSFAIFCLALFAAIVAVNAEPKGVDDWTATDIATFFETEAGAKVEVEAITKIGLTPRCRGE